MDTATAQRPRRWTENPHQTVPPTLAAGLRALRRRQLGGALAACRAAGWGVPALAAAVGMKPDAVAQRICRARRAGNVDAAGLAIPAPELPAEAHPARGFVAGLNPPLPPGAAEHLRELHALARLVRGHLQPGHPYRVASEHLAEDVALLLDQGYRKIRITAALDVTYRAVDQRLERHGHRAPSPSAAHRAGYVHPPTHPPV